MISISIPYSYIHSIIQPEKCVQTKVGLASHTMPHRCHVVQWRANVALGFPTSWVSKGSRIQHFSHALCVLQASRSHLTLSITIKTTNKQHQHAFGGHSRNTVACNAAKYQAHRVTKKMVAYYQRMWVCEDTTNHWSPMYAMRLKLPFHLKMCLMTGNISFTPT
jgi:hypothetical protein